MKKIFKILSLCTALFLISSVNAQNKEKIKISQVLIDIINNKGIDAAVNQYRQLKNSDSTLYDLREAELNNLGYSLLNDKRFSEAIEIFKLNIEMYPDKSNCWDSMAEAYMLDGQRENASLAYQKNFELNPRNLKSKHLSNEVFDMIPAIYFNELSFNKL